MESLCKQHALTTRFQKRCVRKKKKKQNTGHYHDINSREAASGAGLDGYRFDGGRHVH